MSDNKVRLSEENRIVGVFGESLVAFQLIKRGVHVLLVDTVFFDLIVKDGSGRTFSKEKNVGISVKFRDRRFTTPSCSVVVEDSSEIESFAEKWNVVPWFCLIICSVDKDGKDCLEGFLFSAQDAHRYMVDKGRKNAVSFSKLRKAKNDGVITSHHYFCWSSVKTW